MNLPYDWYRDIEPRLTSIREVAGGYTNAHRGVITMNDGKQLFVKIATDDNTKKWTKKEVASYQLLSEHNFVHAPKLLATKPDLFGFAVEYLGDYEFDHVWDKNMLQSVMAARTELQKFKPYFESDKRFTLDSVVDFHSRWPELLNAETIDFINTVYLQIGSSFQLTVQMVEGFVDEMKHWHAREDTLVHQDIRADNFGYNAQRREGKLVDWNWLCIGDNTLDITPLFVSIYRTGFDPYQQYPELYDRQALLYAASFWLRQLLYIEDINAISTLRIQQAESARVCLTLIATS